MADELVTLLLTTPEMTRNLPPLPEMTIGPDGKSYWDNSNIEVDYDDLIRLGYFKEVKQCPTCKGLGHLEK